MAAALPVQLPLIVCARALEPFGCDADWLLQRMSDAADLPIDREASRVLASGRAELSGALDVVARRLLLQEWPACLLLGVDSLVASCPAFIAGWGSCGGGAEPGSSTAALAEAAGRALVAAGLSAAALGAVCHDGSGDWGQLEELALANRDPDRARPSRGEATAESI